MSNVAQADTKLEASIMVHFGSGKAILNAKDKARLRRFFQKYETGPKSRIFVVGYTDARGAKGHNYKLSRQRAQTIRRQLISIFGLKANVVMALGKGEENPISDNRSASGRASNRRAEIYLVNTKIRTPKRIYGPNDPYLTDIQTLVQEAQTLIKQRRLTECIRVLKKARGLGGDHYADWHAAYGIAGFYAHAPDVDINYHLATALQLDPFNEIARGYLGRFTARLNVKHRKVTDEMGLSADHAIAITSLDQLYEYLRLFNVTPLSHHQLDGGPLDRWECINARGAPVVYYFDHSPVHNWAFAKRSAGKKSTAVNAGTINPLPKKEAKSVSQPPRSEKSISKDPRSIWESKLFN